MDVSSPTIEHPDPLPAVGGEIETAHSIAKHRKRPPPKERNVSDTAKKPEGELIANEEASVDRPTGSLDDESWQEPLHASVM